MPRPAPRNTLAFLLTLLMAAFSCSNRRTDEGRLTVSPDRAEVGSRIRLEFSLTVPEPGIRAGGGLQIELPVAGTRSFGNKVVPVLMEAPRRESIELVSSQKNVDLALTSDASGALPRKILSVEVRSGTLPAGSSLDVRLMTKVRATAGRIFWKYRTRPSADSQWSVAPTNLWPEFNLVPGTPAFGRLVGPADLTVGETFALRLIFHDRFGNAASPPRGTVHFACEAGLPQGLAKGLELTGHDEAAAIALNGLSYPSAGNLRVRAEMVGTPIHGHAQVIHSTPPNWRRFFGDTQFHTGSGTDYAFAQPSGDHYGNYTAADQAYTFARDVALLDFASLSEHDAGMSPKSYRRICETTQSFDDPPRFATLFAWEFTPNPSRHAHQVIVSTSSLLPYVPRGDAQTPEALWRALDRSSVPILSIPHPMFSERTRNDRNPIFDRDKRNANYQVVGEIYSHHAKDARGWRGPADDAPQIYEEGVDRECSFQHAWVDNFRIGVIGSSDNHLQTPGIPSYTPWIRQAGGLAVVLATSNDREAIFEALTKRRCYATTGSRIYLDITANGHPMGSEIKIPAGSEVLIDLTVAASDRLEEITVLKLAGKSFLNIYEEDPGSDRVSASFSDRPNSDTLYYLRVRQKDFSFESETLPGHMAFSSPIWVDIED